MQAPPAPRRARSAPLSAALRGRAQPRGKAGSPHHGDGRLAPSGAEAADAALGRLAATRADLDAWAERLRAWLAAELLQPLVRLLDGAHAVRAPNAARPPALAIAGKRAAGRLAPRAGRPAPCPLAWPASRPAAAARESLSTRALRGDGNLRIGA